jgi:hypothetical protein
MKAIYLFVFLSFPLILFAQIGRQGSINVSTGADFLIPSSTLATTNRAGFGFSSKFEHVFARHTSVTVSGSIYHFPGDKSPDLNVIPVLAGLRYYLGNFYLGAEAGNGFGLQPDRQNGFVYAFSAGDEIVTGRNGNSLDISFRIQGWSPEKELRFYGVRVAYEFRLR